MDNVVDLEEVLDIAIIGGGVSGLYSAWRLKIDQPALKIAVFEESDRLGGRLMSLTPPGMPNVKVELGGMRFMDSQTIVSSLVDELELRKVKLPADKPENLAYLRGKHLRQSQYADKTNVPYNLEWFEQGCAPGNLIGYCIDQILPQVAEMNGEELLEFLETYTVDGRNLWQHGFWNLLRRTMSHEAYEYARDAGGYDSTSLNWNAAETILLNFDFIPGTQFWALEEGYQAVPRILAQRFEKLDGAIHLHRRLRALDSVTLPDGSPGVTLEFHPSNKLTVGPVTARHVVLAMPRRAIELLDATGTLLGAGVGSSTENYSVRDLIESVTPIPLFKFVSCYEYPWWEHLGLTGGRSVTDLPIRQCYYWGVESEQQGGYSRNHSAALMATYDDILNVDFWEGLAAGPSTFSYNTVYTDPHNPHGHSASREWKHHRAPDAMVDEIQRQIQEMHGIRYVPRPYDAAFMDWGKDPYGGGVNFWRINKHASVISKAIVQPRHDIPVYICGEAYSRKQGWVEGALETAEDMLTRCFGLGTPQWHKPSSAQTDLVREASRRVAWRYDHGHKPSSDQAPVSLFKEINGAQHTD